MANQGSGGISWTEVTWNPIRGCRRVNKDCLNCYAERFAVRFAGPGRPYEGLARMTEDGPRWTGKIRLIQSALERPLSWKRPKLVFVNSMSDLFMDDLMEDEIDAVVAVMALCSRHTFQVLTKRPTRMAEYLNDKHRRTKVLAAAAQFGAGNPATGSTWWPLRNVWWGVSMGHQEAADRFLQPTLRCRQNAYVLWVSAEPLIEVMDISGYMVGEDRIDWVVGGGESGPNARRCFLQAARGLRDQCKFFHVPFHWKQAGDNPESIDELQGRLLDGELWDDYPRFTR